MSAQFIVTFRGQPVRFTYSAGRSIWEIGIASDRATRFISEPEAWHEALRHELPGHLTDVISAANLQPTVPQLV